MESNNKELNSLLTKELQNLEQRQTDLEAQRTEISEKLDEVRSRKDLIKALLGVPGEGSSTAAPDGQSKTGSLTNRESRKLVNVADIAFDIVVARGKKPIHYEELTEQILAAGGVLGGQTPAQTLVARLSRDPRFVRPEKRGWYAARQFYPHARNVGQRKQPAVGRKRA